MTPRIACAILAAGGSTRLGRPKQLLTFDGAPLVHRVAEQACASICDLVAVVVGAHGAAVAEAVNGLNVAVIENPGWSEGMASSIRAAARWAFGCDALILVACDQPYLSAVHVNALAAAHTPAAPVASAYSGVLGVPALFPAAWFDRLRALTGDRGAGGLLRDSSDVVSIPWPEGALDVDTEDDVERLTPAGAARPS